MWYEEHKRELPWRKTSDPYHIWLSEVILQQTRVAQGLPYFERFVGRFPTVHHLAAATRQEVLTEWQGLGYYSRARNLHDCAQMVVKEFSGEFPGTYTELIKLKGIGAYTAAAIASLAFGEAVPVIDGNVFRVVARMFGVFDDIAVAASRKVFDAILREIIPADNAGVFNQAVMEFGALHCTPARPGCETCVFQQACYAFAYKAAGRLPVKSKTTKVKTRYLSYFMFEGEGVMLFRERTAKDIWQGLFDFYAVEGDKLLEEQEAWEILAGQLEPQGWEIKEVSADFKHILTHRIIFARFFRVKMPNNSALKTTAEQLKLRMVAQGEFENIPKPVLITGYLNTIFA